jgi:hypothetical protein
MKKDRGTIIKISVSKTYTLPAKKNKVPKNKKNDRKAHAFLGKTTILTAYFLAKKNPLITGIAINKRLMISSDFLKIIGDPNEI